MYRIRVVLSNLVVGGMIVGVPAPRPGAAQEAEPFRVAAHPGEDQSLDWRLEELWRAGGVNDPHLGAIAFLSPSTLAADDSGNIHVLDRAAFRVLVLSPEGRVIDSLGSRGEGPGELTNPIAISVSDGGILNAYDVNRGGLVRWRLDSRTAADPVRVRASYSYGMELHVHGDAVHFTALEFLEVSGDEVRSRYSLVRWTPAETTLLTPGREFKRVSVHLPECRVFGTHMGQIFEPVLAWGGRDERVAVAKDRDYIVHVFDDGRAVLRIERDLAGRRVTEGMARREVEGARDGAVGPPQLRRLAGSGGAGHGACRVSAGGYRCGGVARA